MDRQPDIDDLFRRRLYDAEVTPPPFVWPNVEAALRKRKRRWLFFGLLAMGLAGAGFWYARSFESAAADLAKMEKAPLQIPAPPPSPALGAATPKAPALSQPASNPPGTVTPAKTLRPKNLQPDKTAATVFFENTLPTESTQRDLEVRKSGATVVQIFENQEDIPEDGRALPQSGHSDRDLNAGHDDPLPTALAPEARLFSVRGFEYLPVESAPLAFARKHRLEQVAPILKKSKEPRKCYSFAKDTRALLVDVYGGPSIAHKELSVSNAENENYLQQRLRTEKQDWAFNLGIRGTYVFQRNLLLRTGLHYDQNVEIFEHFDPNSVKVVVQYLTKTIGGQQVTVVDTLSIDYGEEYIKSYNRFGMLELPITAGIELRAGNTGISLNGGAAFNLLYWKRGALLGPDGKSAWFSKGRQEIDVFRSNTGLSLLGSVQWFWHLRPRLRIFAEPYARYILKPVTIPGYPVQQHGGFWGLKVGLTKIID